MFGHGTNLKQALDQSILSMEPCFVPLDPPVHERVARQMKLRILNEQLQSVGNLVKLLSLAGCRPYAQQDTMVLAPLGASTPVAGIGRANRDIGQSAVSWGAGMKMSSSKQTDKGRVAI